LAQRAGRREDWTELLDAEDIPQAEFFRGEASDSALPPAWAHAERIKMRRSPRDGRVFGLPPQPVQRYSVEKTGQP